MANLLSIICPTFNSAQNIRVLIDSVLAQTCSNYELIIVDGGSADGTLSIVGEYGDRIRCISGPDDGIYDAMNKGVRVANGRWLYFIGSDDKLFNKHVIKRLQSHLQKNTDVVLCDIDSPTLGRCSSNFSNMMYLHNTIHHQGVIYNRRVFEQYMYDKMYKIMGDYDLNMYIWHNDFKIERADITFAMHMPHGVSDQPRFKNYYEEIMIRNKYMDNSLFKRILAGVSFMKYTYKVVKRQLLPESYHH